jgi:hypothetical protein
MEKRALIAIALSVVLLVAWQMLFTPPPPPPAPPAERPAGAPPVLPGPPGSSPPAAPAPSAGETGAAVARPPAVTGAAPGGRGAEVVTPLYQIVFGPDGAATGGLCATGGRRSWRSQAAGTAGGRGEPTGPAPEAVALRPDAERLELGAQQPTGSLTFSGATTDGVRLEKRLRFDATSYRIQVELRAEGAGSGAEPATLVSTGRAGGPGPHARGAVAHVRRGHRSSAAVGTDPGRPSGEPQPFEAPAATLKDPKESPAGPELKDPQLVPVAVLPEASPWVALENDYFIAALVPSGEGRVLRGGSAT